MPTRSQQPPALIRHLFGKAPIVPIIRLEGQIAAPMGGRGGLSLQRIEKTLQRAYTRKRAPAVVLVINSPGGSPAQASLIAQRIRDLAAREEKRTIAFVEDVAASGGYWIALAADEIYADPNSIVGSIGVVSSLFGFHELIRRYGVERRLYSTGDYKAFMDPFTPTKPHHADKLRNVQAALLEEFKAHVEARRGDRLTGDREELFSGAFWTGRQALERGLIDGIALAAHWLRKEFGEEAILRPMAPRRPVPVPFLGAMIDEIGLRIEERLALSRFGL